jgi:tripartite-type tricarboxylate transporter receptor subunit TctC
MTGLTRRALALAGFALLSLSPASAETAEEFFKKNSQIKLIVSSSPGGGYDMFARLVAKYMGPRLPGSPAVIVQNMPGGGGMRAANHLYNVAPKDGSTFAIIDRGILTSTMLNGPDSNAQFDPAKFLWLGSVSREFGVGVLGINARAKTLEEMKTKEVAFGGSGREGDTSMYTRLFNTLFGTKIKSIPAYAGQTEYYLAMTRGETDGLFMSGWSGPNKMQAQEDEKQGRTRYFVQITDKRHPDFGDVPTIMELLKTDEERRMIEVILSRLTLGRPFIAPPDVPADRLAVLRAAFKAAVDDPDFRAEAARQGTAVDPIYGEEAQAMLAKVLATPDDVVQKLRKVFNPS